MVALFLVLSALSFYAAGIAFHLEPYRWAAMVFPGARRLAFFWCVVLWPLPWMLAFFGLYLQVEPRLRLGRARAR
jgi:hypothetical protein